MNSNVGILIAAVAIGIMLFVLTKDAIFLVNLFTHPTLPPP